MIRPLTTVRRALALVVDLVVGPRHLDAWSCLSCHRCVTRPSVRQVRHYQATRLMRCPRCESPMDRLLVGTPPAVAPEPVDESGLPIETC